MVLTRGAKTLWTMENFKTALLFDANGDLSKRWFVYYFFRNPETGKYQRWRNWIPQTIKTKGSRYVRAKEIITRINTQLRTGFNPYSKHNRGLINIEQAIEFVLECKEQNVRKRTYHSYRSHAGFLTRFLKANKLHRIPIEDFNSTHAQDFLDWYKKKRSISNRTYNNVILSMEAIFSFLRKRNYILINPFGNIERLPIEEPDIIAFNEKDRKILREKLPEYNYDLYIISQLIFSCFLRPQELVRLKVRHFEIDKGMIIIPGYVSKNKKNEVVVIPRSLVEKLKDFDLNYPEEYFVFSKDLKRGQQENYPTRIAEAWREFANQHGISKNIYALKHTGNGLAVEQGINIRDIQLQNRHSDLSITQKYLDRFRRIPSDRLKNDFPEL